jgi:hemerythrin-like metal-binding protein
MAKLSWNKRYSVDVKTLDNQHAGLFADLNELYAATSNGQSRSATDSLLRDLLKNALAHFSAEEALLEATEYPALAQHRAKHRNFVRQVEEYLARRELGDGANRLPLLDFIRDWFTNHMQQEDREYGPWLNEHGVR